MDESQSSTGRHTVRAWRHVAVVCCIATLTMMTAAAVLLASTAVSLVSAVTGVDILVSKVHTGQLNEAVIYRPLTSSPKHGVSIAEFCSEFSELLDELLALPGQLVVYGDFIMRRHSSRRSPA